MPYKLQHNRDTFVKGRKYKDCALCMEGWPVNIRSRRHNVNNTIRPCTHAFALHNKVQSITVAYNWDFGRLRMAVCTLLQVCNYNTVTREEMEAAHTPELNKKYTALAQTRGLTTELHNGKLRFKDPARTEKVKA